MADIASRSFTNNIFTNSNKTFEQTFNSLFPLQSGSWKEYTLSPKTLSKVISTLCGEQSPMALWLKILRQEKNIGLTGPPTHHSSTKIHTSQTAQTKNKSSLSPPLLQGSGKATTEKESKSPFKQLLKHYQPSQRPVNWLDNLPQSSKQKKRTKSQWHGSLRDTEEKTRLQHHNLHCQSLFQKNVKGQALDPTTV